MQKMLADVNRFVRNCDTFRRTPTARHFPFGVLRPLSIVQQRWDDILIEFVTGPSWLNGCNAIRVIYDRLTKMRHLITYKGDTDTRELAKLFIRHV